MGCMVLCRTFYTDLNKNRENGLCTHFSGPETVSGACFNGISMDFRCLVLISDTASLNGFCIDPSPGPGHTQCDDTVILTSFVKCATSAS